MGVLQDIAKTVPDWSALTVPAATLYITQSLEAQESKAENKTKEIEESLKHIDGPLYKPRKAHTLKLLKKTDFTGEEALVLMKSAIAGSPELIDALEYIRRKNPNPQYLTGGVECCKDEKFLKTLSDEHIDNIKPFAIQYATEEYAKMKDSSLSGNILFCVDPVDYVPSPLKPAEEKVNYILLKTSGDIQAADNKEKFLTALSQIKNTEAKLHLVSQKVVLFNRLQVAMTGGYRTDFCYPEAGNLLAEYARTILYGNPATLKTVEECMTRIEDHCALQITNDIPRQIYLEDALSRMNSLADGFKQLHYFESFNRDYIDEACDFVDCGYDELISGFMRSIDKGAANTLKLHADRLSCIHALYDFQSNIHKLDTVPGLQLFNEAIKEAYKEGRWGQVSMLLGYLSVHVGLTDHSLNFDDELIKNEAAKIINFVKSNPDHFASENSRGLYLFFCKLTSFGIKPGDPLFPARDYNRQKSKQPWELVGLPGDERENLLWYTGLLDQLKSFNFTLKDEPVKKFLSKALEAVNNRDRKFQKRIDGIGQALWHRYQCEVDQNGDKAARAALLEYLDTVDYGAGPHD